MTLAYCVLSSQPGGREKLGASSGEVAGSAGVRGDKGEELEGLLGEEEDKEEGVEVEDELLGGGGGEESWEGCCTGCWSSRLNVVDKFRDCEGKRTGR